MNLHKVSVEARHINLSYGTTEVLKDVNIRIEPGEFFALLGPSGSGKSTLLRLIAGFNQHQRGELLIDGKDITGTPPHLRNVGMVFQNYALWPHMTVWDNVAFGLVERRESRDAIRRKVGAALELVGLQDYGQRRPGQQHQLGLGFGRLLRQPQRVADEIRLRLDSVGRPPGYVRTFRQLRPDVARHFSRPSLTASGFATTIDTSHMRGAYKIVISAIASGRTYECPLKIDINITS